MAHPTIDYADAFAHKVKSTLQFGGSGTGLWDDSNATSSISFGDAGHYGGKALTITKAAGGGVWISRKFQSSQTKVVSFYIYWDATPSGGDQDIFSVWLFSNSSQKASLRSKSGKYAIGWGGANVDNGTTINAGQWDRVDIKFDVSASTYTASVKINGGSTFTQTLAGQPTTDTFNKWRLGTTESAAVYTARYADFIEGNTLADWPMGDHACKVMNIDADGNSNGNLKLENSDGTHTYAAYVDSWAPSTSSYVAQISNGASNYIETTFEDITEQGSLVGEVFALAALSASGTNVNDSTLYYVDPSLTFQVFSGSIGSTSLNYVVRRLGDLTLTDMQSAVMRFGYSTDVSPAPRWNGGMLVYVRWQGTVTAIVPFTTTPAMAVTSHNTFRTNPIAFTTTAPSITALGRVPTRDSAALTTTPAMSIIGRRKQFDTVAFATTPTFTVAGTKVAFGIASLATTPTLAVTGYRGQNTGVAFASGTPVLNIVTGTQTVVGQIAFTTTPSLTVSANVTAGHSSTGIIHFATTPFMDVFGTRVGTPFYMGESLLRKEWLRDVAETGGVERGRIGFATNPSLTVVGRFVSLATIAFSPGSPLMGVTGRRGQFGITHLTTTPAMVVVGTRFQAPPPSNQIAFATNPFMNVLGRIIPIPTPNQVFLVTNPRMTVVGQATPRFVVKGTCDLDEDVRTVLLEDFDPNALGADIGAALGITATLDEGAP